MQDLTPLSETPIRGDVRARQLAAPNIRNDAGYVINDEGEHANAAVVSHIYAQLN